VAASLESELCNPARPGRPRDEAREQAILDAAVELIVEVGYDRMSMDAVAARAHASKATIYRRWPGKVDLVVEALRRRTCVSLECSDTGGLRNDILSTLTAMRETMQKVDGPLMTGVLLAAQSDAELASVLRTTVLADKQQVWSGIVDRAVSRGEVDPAADAALVCEVASAMGFARIVVSGEPFDEAFCEHLVDHILLPLLPTV
jgi:AcrR family transcriptional regulator